jgi:hypothetical protein
MSKSNIGRPILGNRTQYNEGEANGQQTKKKEDTSQYVHPMLSVSFPF